MTSSISRGSASTTSGAELPTVLVLGCGWLGLALARSLAADGHVVLGTTTTPETMATLETAGIQPHLLRLGNDFDAASEALLMRLLKAADVLVLNVPPRAAAAGAYPQLLRPVHRAVAQARVGAVLFVSTVGVYPDEPRVMTEPDALSTRDASSDVLRTEGHFVPRYNQWRSTVARLGGLIGPDRPPGRFLAGRHNLPQGSAPTNLLHLIDAVGVLRTIIEEGCWGHTLNVCAAQHPLRRDFYPTASRYLDLAPPTFRPDDGGGRLIDSSLLRRVVPYTFTHDDVLAAIPFC